MVWKLLLLHNPLLRMGVCLEILYLHFCLYPLSYLILKRLVCLSGYLGSSTSIQKLFCGSLSTCRSFFFFFPDLLIYLCRRKLSSSYTSSILGSPSLSVFFFKVFIFLLLLCISPSLLSTFSIIALSILVIDVLNT